MKILSQHNEMIRKLREEYKLLPYNTTFAGVLCDCCGLELIQDKLQKYPQSYTSVWCINKQCRNLDMAKEKLGPE